MLWHQQAGDKGDNGRNVGAKENDGQHGDDKGPDDHFGDRDLGNGGGHIQLQPHRRGNCPDHDDHQNDQGEVDGREAHGFSQGEEDGRKGYQRHGAVHKQPHNHQQHDDQQHDHIGVGGNAEEESHQNAGEILPGDDKAEQGGETDNQAGNRRVQSGPQQYLWNVFQRHVPVNDNADKEAVHHSDGGRLGGGADAVEHGADDDNRGEQGPGGAFCSRPFFRPCGAGILGPAQLFSKVHRYEHLGKADKDSGHDSAHEEFSNGQSCDAAVENHDDAGRYDGSNAGGGGRHAGGIFRGIAVLHHGGDHDGPHGYRVGGGRAGKAGHEHTGDNVGVGQRAAPVPQHGVAKRYDSPCDAAGVHNFACQHKQGNRQQWKGVKRHENFLGNHNGSHAVQGENADQTGDAHGESRRHAERQKDGESKEHHQHQKTSPFWSK